MNVWQMSHSPWLTSVTFAAIITVNDDNNTKESMADKVMEKARKVVCAKVTGKAERSVSDQHWAWLNILQLHRKSKEQTMVIN